jgi:RNA polymerase sigma factor (TIGR02999 family)
MNEVTLILSASEQSGPKATAQWFTLVYDELRKLAAAKLARLARMGPGQSIQPTELVHEAYVRLMKTGQAPIWNSRGHFFVAAAEAMRRILVERARRSPPGHRPLEGVDIAVPGPSEDLIALDKALEKLEACHPLAAQVVKLRYFAGLTIAETADVLEMAPQTVNRRWKYARVWLLREIRGGA